MGLVNQRDWLARVVDVRSGETRPMVLAAAQFFLLMFGYFLLRPLRETMGLRGGPEHVQTLFRITVAVMLMATPVYGFAAARIRRGVLVPGVYAFTLLCLGGFLAGMLVIPEASRAWLGDVFYIWLSVLNLFIVSVFWQLLADIFTLEQSKRLFGFIGVGGTAGAIAGSSLAWRLSEALGTVGLIAWAWALIGVSMLIAVVLCGVRRRGEIERRTALSELDAGAATPGAVGGSAWAGLGRLIASRYLGAIGLTVMLFAVTSTLLYFEKIRLVEMAAGSDGDRTALFAGITLSGQVLTILFQIFLTGRLMRLLGVGVLLAVVPIVSLIGFLALDLVGTIAVYTVFEATRSAGNYALSKPARETLFTVVSRQDKYKAKAGIDTFVYRGGDVAGSLASAKIMALGLPISVFAVPLGIVGVVLSWWLGRTERRLADGDAEDTG